MLDLLELLNWIKDNQALYWLIWFSWIMAGYAAAEAICNIIRAWHAPKYKRG